MRYIKMSFTLHQVDQAFIVAVIHLDTAVRIQKNRRTVREHDALRLPDLRSINVGRHFIVLILWQVCQAKKQKRKQAGYRELWSPVLNG